MTGAYALLDAGGGRRLERFGARIVDRPAPGALHPPLDPGGWASADLVFERPASGDGRWTRGGSVAPWTVHLREVTLELRPAAGGQLGLFPEHAALWPWVGDAVRATASRHGRPPEVLSLFAYTGGASLTAALAGARVAHVDASRPAVAWARRNAALSGLADAPLRWLVDDARGFVARELRRGRRYDGLILDPPTYGHGPSGTAWRLERDLGALLADLAALAPDPGFVLLTAHTPEWGPAELGGAVRAAFGLTPDVDRLVLAAASGASLEQGALARWARP